MSYFNDHYREQKEWNQRRPLRQMSDRPTAHEQSTRPRPTWPSDEYVHSHQHVGLHQHQYQFDNQPDYRLHATNSDIYSNRTSSLNKTFPSSLYKTNDVTSEHHKTPAEWSRHAINNLRYQKTLQSTADSSLYDTYDTPGPSLQHQTHCYINSDNRKVAYPVPLQLRKANPSDPPYSNNNNNYNGTDDNNNRQKSTSTHITVITQPCGRHPVGLRNIGNTCYFNSIMQNLYQTFLFERELHSVAHRRSSYIPLTESLVDFYDSMKSLTSLSHGGIVQPYTPSRLFNELCYRSSRFAGGRQQDSHELLRHLMDAVKEEEKQSLNVIGDKLRQLTAVDRVFGGHYLTVFHCEECSTPYHLFEPFLDISLPVKWETPRKLGIICHLQKKRRSKSAKSTLLSEYAQKIEDITKVLPAETNNNRWDQRASVHHPGSLSPGSLINSLSFYTRAEDLNEYMCLECNKDLKNEFKLTKASKQTLIYSPPAVLTIHLKRFEQTKHGYTKSNSPVEFQETLDLSPFCSQYSMRQTGTLLYELYGVVLHEGTLHGGHYKARVRVRQPDTERTTAFLQQTFFDRDEFMSRDKLIELVRNGAKDKLFVPHSSSSSNSTEKEWYKISDSRVERTNKTKVLKHKSDVYLLFYERVS